MKKFLLIPLLVGSLYAEPFIKVRISHHGKEYFNNNTAQQQQVLPTNTATLAVNDALVDQEKALVTDIANAMRGGPRMDIMRLAGQPRLQRILDEANAIARPSPCPYITLQPNQSGQVNYLGATINAPPNSTTIGIDIGLFAGLPIGTQVVIYNSLGGMPVPPVGAVPFESNGAPWKRIDRAGHTNLPTTYIFVYAQNESNGLPKEDHKFHTPKFIKKWF